MTNKSSARGVTGGTSRSVVVVDGWRLVKGVKIKVHQMRCEVNVVNGKKSHCGDTFEVVIMGRLPWSANEMVSFIENIFSWV